MTILLYNHITKSGSIDTSDHSDGESSNYGEPPQEPRRYFNVDSWFQRFLSHILPPDASCDDSSVGERPKEISG